ncbi:MAG: cysteine desulfurase [Cyclobacteriaceae bacterium]|nr:cysteine desulfurase [Cyclobacteriaceae bacterium]
MSSIHSNTQVKGFQEHEIEQLRKEFPILHQSVNGKPLVYFDNAATTQKPKVVIESLTRYYFELNSNIHRGAHYLADKATTAFENTRQLLHGFINSDEAEEIIFTQGTTDSINLVANSYGRKFLKEGDEVIISGMEHHSNIVPWQMVCEEKKAHLKIIPVEDDGTLNIEAFKGLLSEKTKIVSVVHISNALGTINPVEEIISLAHQIGAVVFIDGAQASAHLDIDVKKLKCDFYAFSGHKVFGPTGIGILYGKRKLLEAMNPYRGGGEMIREVTFEKTTYNDIPFKFEAGTPNIADVIAFGTALEFTSKLGKKNIAAYEEELREYCTTKLLEIPEIRIIGTAPDKASVVSFLVEGMHPFDVGMMLDAKGIAVRTGHHCTQPLMQRFGIEGTIRISLAVYNTFSEIDICVEALKEIIKKWK